MKEFIDFFVEVGKLRKMLRRGGILIGSKSPSTITDHLFRVAIMALALGKKKGGDLKMGKVLEMALVHDLCELYTGDESPYDYDSILPKDKNKWPQLFERWPRLTPKDKEKRLSRKRRNEQKAFERLTRRLPDNVKNLITSRWQEYEKSSSREARFIKQINRLETLLQALEYGREEGIRVYESWWVGSRERIDDPLLISFMDSLAKSFGRKKKK